MRFDSRISLFAVLFVTTGVASARDMSAAALNASAGSLFANDQATCCADRNPDTHRRLIDAVRRDVVAAATSQSSLKATLQHALSRPASAAEPPEAAIQVLSFHSDPAVTAREQERIIAHLASQPDGGAGFTQAIRSGKLLGEFNRLLRRYDHSANNLGDVLAAHLIMSWEIVNDRDSRQVPAGQRAVRRQLMAPLAALPKYARMSDADKQAQAERTAYLTMISVTAYQSLKRSGDTAQLGSLQRNLREKFLASGIDLRRLELTDGGLVLH